MTKNRTIVGGSSHTSGPPSSDIDRRDEAPEGGSGCGAAAPEDVTAPEFCHRHRVTYAECTLGNHVYYSNYLAILEAARGELFRHVGASCLHWQEQGLMFPVIECAFRFLTPARYDDELAIRLWLSELRGVRMTFVYRVENARGQIMIEGETRHVCASLDEKPRRLPALLTERLAPYVRRAAP